MAKIYKHNGGFMVWKCFLGLPLLPVTYRDFGAKEWRFKLFKTRIKAECIARELGYEV